MSTHCHLCPRACGVVRSDAAGFCGAGEEMQVAAVCMHRGEEPPLNPIVNVFFAHCNLQCIYCQNRQISGRHVQATDGGATEVDAVADRIEALLASLSPTDAPMLGLVTAAHYADRLPALLDAVHRRGVSPTVVYNSSGYETVGALRTLEGLVDIYLPDFKYMDPALASAYSHAADYPAVAQAALREMRRQVGAGLKVDADGHAYRGLIVRHLVLPGAVDNSLQCLEWLAGEFPFGLHLSLMSQYFPPHDGLPAPLDRPLGPDEYAAVTARAMELGLTDGWFQEPESRDNYRPDFSRGNPFQTSAS